MELDQYMRIAIEEAKVSLREGNHGFGTVIVRDGNIITAAHDREDTGNDSTSHAEINAIREASRKLGKNLSGCILISTHEPCPMCASAIVWSGITAVVYGYSIKEAVSQRRTRMEFPCAEIFARSGVDIRVHEGILNTECSVLYRKDVRDEIKRLRNADDRILAGLNEDSVRRRTEWFQENQSSFDFITGDLPGSGYRLLLKRFRITEKETPVIRRSDREIVFHSMNFCPTLEACKILELDTRYVCQRLNENSTDILVKQIDSRLRFSRNYAKLRPYTEYCEEIITISENQ